jgi:hypothetical protein
MLLSLTGEKRYEGIVYELEAGKIGLGEGKKRLEKLSK